MSLEFKNYATQNPIDTLTGLPENGIIASPENLSDNSTTRTTGLNNAIVMQEFLAMTKEMVRPEYQIPGTEIYIRFDVRRPSFETELALNFMKYLYPIYWYKVAGVMSGVPILVDISDVQTNDLSTGTEGKNAPLSEAKYVNGELKIGNLRYWAIGLKDQSAYRNSSNKPARIGDYLKSLIGPIVNEIEGWQVADALVKTIGTYDVATQNRLKNMFVGELNQTTGVQKTTFGIDALFEDALKQVVSQMKLPQIRALSPAGIITKVRQFLSSEIRNNNDINQVLIDLNRYLNMSDIGYAEVVNQRIPKGLTATQLLQTLITLQSDRIKFLLGNKLDSKIEIKYFYITDGLNFSIFPAAFPQKHKMPKNTKKALGQFGRYTWDLGINGQIYEITSKTIPELDRLISIQPAEPGVQYADGMSAIKNIGVNSAQEFNLVTGKTVFNNRVTANGFKTKPEVTNGSGTYQITSSSVDIFSNLTPSFLQNSQFTASNQV